MTAREPLDLNRLAALDARATPGPWRVVLDDTESPTTVWQVCASPSHTEEVDPNGDTVFDCCADGGLHGEPFFLERDAEFVAEARTALPALVAELRALRAKLDLPCGSCHPCTEWSAETWRRADRTVPDVHQWDEVLAERDQARADAERLTAQLAEATVKAVVTGGPVVTLADDVLPERTAVPGEPLPPIPDSAYPAGATPLATVDHRSIISRAHRHLIATGWRGDSCTPMAGGSTEYVLRRPGGRIEALVGGTGKLTAVTLAGLSPEQISDLARAVGPVGGDR
ncbi:hypothetical protein O7626_39430 [Micromonospora sp. WMMD1102]|uniref:hypothetical protein n=1 Tax=Micromonospora sp. WMMD1102 TaxID=3016105 RepID=UPI002414D7D2|nr:hypothetical protein [Micromonospora sp. WMMD1102]MDG4791888.1 hypothetical protein [Micromonospora sp. WMMD1102]